MPPVPRPHQRGHCRHHRLVCTSIWASVLGLPVFNCSWKWWHCLQSTCHLRYRFPYGTYKDQPLDMHCRAPHLKGKGVCTIPSLNISPSFTLKVFAGHGDIAWLWIPQGHAALFFQLFLPVTSQFIIELVPGISSLNGQWVPRLHYFCWQLFLLHMPVIYLYHVTSLAGVGAGTW